MYGGPADRGRADDIRPYRSGGGRTRVRSGQPPRKPVPRPALQTQKGALVPSHGTRAPYSRGATHVQSGTPLPLSFCCGKGTAPVSGPAGRAVSRAPAADAFSRWRPLCGGGCRGTCPVRAVLPDYSIPNREKSQSLFLPGGEKSTSPQLPLFCWRVTTGFGSVSSSPPAGGEDGPELQVVVLSLDVLAHVGGIPQGVGVDGLCGGAGGNPLSRRLGGFHVHGAQGGCRWGRPPPPE